MADYKAPLRDMKFVLNEVFQAEKLWASMPGTEEVSADIVDAILEEGAKVAEGLIAPLNRSGDEQGARWEDGNVIVADGYKEAWDTYKEGGWVGLSGNADYDGQGMPKMLSVVFEEMLYSADNSFALMSSLTGGACLAIDAHADEKWKKMCLPRMYSGEWAGSMCLTEPHSGTDLGIIRTKAEPQADGTYTVSGTKIFITNGEHNLTDQIIHLVLAKLPDAPAGSKGISLFIVPKLLINDDESLGENNNVSCGSIEHKMGIKASPTCVMNFDGAKGYMIGEPNKGLSYMFTMMNYERLSIGMQGIGCAERSYQNASEYARERLQGRSPSGPKQPDKMADSLLVHPDVRRMLLTMRASTEAGRAFASYVGMYLDMAKYHPDDEQRKQAEGRVALLTPVAKAFFTDQGLDSCVHGQQVFGGHGYVREWGQEQLVRDVRIGQIYEGTNGVQAMDLIGRKLIANGGALLSSYTQEIAAFCAEQSGASMAEFIQPLQASLTLLSEVTEHVLQVSKNDPCEAGSAAVEYLALFGYVSYAYMWAKMASVALEPSNNDADFYEVKLQVGRFFMERLLPKVQGLAASITSGSGTLMAISEDAF